MNNTSPKEMLKRKWYLSIWFISLLLVFSITIIPLIVAVILLVKHHQESKRINNYLFNDLRLEEILDVEIHKEKLNTVIEELKIEKSALLQQKAQNESTIKETNVVITELKNQLSSVENESSLQDFGLYTPRYNLIDSEAYKKRLNKIRDKQKQLVSEYKATDHMIWTVNGSEKEGKKLTYDNIKMIIRAFNNECEVAVFKVKFNNIESIENRITSAHKTLNKLYKTNKISITNEYLNLKLEELHLAYEYEQKKEEEREEQRQIREQIKEEQRVIQEIKKQREKIEKEEKHFNQAIIVAYRQLQNAKDQEKLDLEEKVRELEAKLAEVQVQKEDVENRERNTRAGYVYIISNIGSFGENVYKIGMTRRLEPMDRVKELGDASVPFTFDVHAMIFSEDAPSLENALHKAFHHKRVNKINERKEFFHVSLDEIELEVKKNFNKVVEFTKLAEAEHYRESLRMNQQTNQPVATA
ncbi:DUF4041 domain-containing protein [Priestia koreensis]|uniref:Bacteriophage T5 Orf172 DNA-binding domain-containing protein n=1 Tax=Priestia koreensis TaxID=284581 RepID=A0A0M0LIX3_9BACI|nr:DUF4041 domain-containing protein [Priestia koreensis]KOO50872.1 hypothetical protein AMD01_03835 [Priestia koreensis]